MSKSKTITALILKCGEYPEVTEIPNDLHTFQQIVGGYIETVSLDSRTDLILNEEGKLTGLDPNRELDYKKLGYQVPEEYRYDIVMGDCLIVGVNNRTGNFTSLREAQIDHYSELFHDPSTGYDRMFKVLFR